MLNCIIIDDDLMSQKQLLHLCEKTPELRVVAVCDNVSNALEAIDTHKPDLAFLDIEMPESTGLDLLDRLAVRPQVIFTTAKRDYAFDAFKYDVTDYLQKPIRLPRFREAVQKVMERHDAKLSRHPQTGLQTTPTLSTDAVFIRVDGKLVRLNINDILYFENIGDYVQVKTTQKVFTIHTTMKALDERLPHPAFLRVHRSYIINVGKIVDIEENTLVIDKKVIPISRANKSALMSRLFLL